MRLRAREETFERETGAGEGDGLEAGWVLVKLMLSVVKEIGLEFWE